MSDLPIAYFITFATYGTRLHGDARGSVDRAHNTPGRARPGYDERRYEAERSQLKQPPVTLAANQRQTITAAMRGVAKHRGWPLHALNVRTNHVHVVVSAASEPEPVMDTFKRWATRRLREAGMIPAVGNTWSRHGSTRWVWNEESLAAVIEYVHFGQGAWIEGCGAPRQSNAATIGSDPAVGLCSDCSHARRIQSDRGSAFWLCEAAADDARLRKYPQLPVLRCRAFEAETT